MLIPRTCAIKLLETQDIKTIQIDFLYSGLMNGLELAFYGKPKDVLMDINSKAPGLLGDGYFMEIFHAGSVMPRASRNGHKLHYVFKFHRVDGSSYAVAKRLQLIGAHLRPAAKANEAMCKAD